AFRRIENHAHAYAPVGLPPYYRVVKEDGEIVSPDKFRIGPAAEPFVTSTAAAQRSLVLFPLVNGAQRYDEYTSPIRWASNFVRLVGGFLPDSASTWTNGYARAPGWFLFLASLVAGLLYASSRI